MNKKFLPVPWLIAVALMAVTTVGLAEAPSRTAGALTITPEMIQRATQAIPPPEARLPLLRRERPPDDSAQHVPENPAYLPRGCAQKGASLCYDYHAGYAVYRPMLKLLPAIPGMTPHNLAIRRHRIVAQYTFK